VRRLVLVNALIFAVLAAAVALAYYGYSAARFDASREREAGLMRDIAGSYTLPLTIAGIFLLPAALSAVSIREKQYSAREQKRPASINAVDTTAAPG